MSSHHIKRGIRRSHEARSHVRHGHHRAAALAFQDAIVAYQDALGNLPASAEHSARAARLRRVISHLRKQMHTEQRLATSRRKRSERDKARSYHAVYWDAPYGAFNVKNFKDKAQALKFARKLRESGERNVRMETQRHSATMRRWWRKRMAKQRKQKLAAGRDPRKKRGKAKKGYPQKRCKRGVVAQSVVFSRKRWNAAKARAWLKRQKNLKAGKLDSSRKGELRFRQVSPSSVKVVGGKEIKPGVRLILGCPVRGGKKRKGKKSRDPAARHYWLVAGLYFKDKQQALAYSKKMRREIPRWSWPESHFQPRRVKLSGKLQNELYSHKLGGSRNSRRRQRYWAARGIYK